MTRVLAAALALALVGALPAGAAASGEGVARVPDAGLPAAPREAPFGRTTLLARDREGGFPNARTEAPSMSADGRFVAFSSYASDIVAGDTSGTQDVFLLDRRSGTTRRLPVPVGFTRDPHDTNDDPAISADGTVVTWVYTPPPPVGAEFFSSLDYVVAYDRGTGKTEVVSRNGKGSPLAGATEPTISADGRYVAYTLASFSSEQRSIQRYDRRREVTIPVSVSVTDANVRVDGRQPSISGDGNLVAFVSNANDSIVFGSSGPGDQVYVRDIAARRTQHVSVASDGGPTNDPAVGPAISGNGRYIAYSSTATNITSHEHGGLFRRDLRTGTNELVSVRPDGGAGNGASLLPSMTRDGRYVAFTTTGTDLVPETLGRIAPAATSRIRAEVMLRDMDAGETILISVARAGGPGGAQSWQGVVAGGGRYVAFTGDSADLVRGDDNDVFDVFLRDLPPVPVINPPVLDFGTRPVGGASLPAAATLTNRGWSALAVTGATRTGAAKADFALVDGCKARRLERDASCTVTVTFKPAAPGTRTATLAVADAYTGSPRTVRLLGRGTSAPVYRPTLLLDPPIGEPGIVTIASGKGYPPNTKVRIAWAPGITPTFHDVTTDAKGLLRVPVLVFHNDLTGPRTLTVRPADGKAFPAVTAPMLVVKPSVVPPRFDLLRILDLPLVLVIRG